ncbi:MAG: LPS export ABC transporter ATP-binding protein [Deltaproteobacteria bacterium]|jgi:lipopolysaccharide export system ATP-binding protein|nr:LPS export ABC transporter ATP-binding protein [Deltaproteobacteria bacterium]
MSDTLRASKLVKTYAGRRVVNGVELELQSGMIIGILGPNGAGKTTTFYMIAGLIRADEGRVFLNDKDITEMPIHERALHGITYLPQEPSVFRKLSVADNIRLVLEIRGWQQNAIDLRTRELLEELGIEGLAGQQAHSLSGGERRRLEVLRALATEPKFILLDEPFAGVDPLAVADLKGIVQRLKTKGIGIVISDHNVRDTLSVCDYAYIVHQGSIIEQGRPEQIISSQLVQQAYLGEDFRL